MKKMNEDYKTLLINIAYRFADANNIKKFDKITFDNRDQLIEMIKQVNIELSQMLNSFYELVIEVFNEKESNDFTQISLMDWILKQLEIKEKLKVSILDLVDYAFKNNINLKDLLIS